MNLLVRLHPDVKIDIDPYAQFACKVAFGSKYAEPDQWDRFTLTTCVYPELDIKHKSEEGWATFKVYGGDKEMGRLVQINPAYMTYRWYEHTPHGESTWGIEYGMRELTIINTWAFLQGVHTCRQS